jgi:hypothetical protein
LLLHRQQRLGVAFGVIDGVVGVFRAAEVFEVGGGVLHEAFVEAAEVRGGETEGGGKPQALEAARLFNAAGRKRTLRIDAMIASTAIVGGAELATNNRTDFNVFVPHGLKLV